MGIRNDRPVVIIDPRFQINYASFYIWGFAKIVDWRNISFQIISDISVDCYEDFIKGSAIIIKKREKKHKVFIDSFDNDKINEKYYKWADVYAKVNTNKNDVSLNKILPIGPGFGIKIWNPVKTVYYGLRNYIKSILFGQYPISFYDFFRNYCYTFGRRAYYSDYHRLDYEEEDGYVFSLNTLWYDEKTACTTNECRGFFVELCDVLCRKFEGGFFYINQKIVFSQFPSYKKYLEKYKRYIYRRRMGMREYLVKTYRSSFVFNTPAVDGCHGWKLGEYLAMSKAIISMSLNNYMPGDFENQGICLFASCKKDIEDLIKELLENPQIRKKMKKRAHIYYEKYLSPDSVVNCILQRCC